MAVVVSAYGKWDGSQLAKAQADLDKLKREAQMAAGGFSSAMATAGAKMKAVGSYISAAGKKMTLGVTLPLVLLGKKATDAAVQYQSAMTQVQAAGDVSRANMRLLRAEAFKMASGFGASSAESAAAMEDLIKAGLSAQDVIGGGLKQALTLATDGQMAASDASTILANAMSVYHLKAKDSVQITDALVASANATTASVSSLAQGLGNVGPVARSAGLHIQDTATALGILDQNGIKGAEGGTALKTFLLRLTPTTQAASTAMADLGLKFTDAHGDMLPMAQVVEQLRQKTKGLSQEQKQQALTTIFGTRGILAANALMGISKKKYDEVSAATRKAGGAQDLLNKQRKTEEFQLKRAAAQWQNAVTVLGGALAPIVETVAGWVEKLAKWFQNLSPTTQKVIVVIGVLAAVLGPLLIVLGAVVTAVGALAGAAAFIGAPILAGVLAVTAFWAALVIAYKKVDWFHDAVQKVFAFLKAAFARVLAYLTGTVWPVIKKVFTVIVNVVRVSIAIVLAIVITWVKAWIKTFQTLWQITEPIRKAIGWIIGFLGDAVGKVARVIHSIWNAITKPFSGIFETFKNIAGNIAKGIWQGLTEAAGWLKDAIWQWVKDVLPGPVEKALGISSPSKVFIQYGKYVTQGLADGIDAGTAEARKSAERLAKAVSDGAEAALASLEDKLGDRLDALKGKFRDFVGTVRDAFTGPGSIASVFQAATADQPATNIVSSLRSQVDQARRFSKDLKQLQKLGLNRTALMQIVSMGPVDGAAAAEQLLANVKSIKAVNRLQGQLRQYGTQTGKALGRPYYAADIAAARNAYQVAQHTTISVEKGAVVVTYPDGATKADKNRIEHVVDAAVQKAIKELAREMKAA